MLPESHRICCSRLAAASTSWTYHSFGIVAVPRRAYVARMPLRCVAYEPRAAERGVLYRVVEEHLERFLDGAADHADGTRLPKFVEQEFRDFLTCGVLAHGFARLRCGGRWPHSAHAQDHLGRRHPPSPLRAPRIARETGRPDPAASDQSRALPWGARPPRPLACPCGRRRCLTPDVAPPTGPTRSSYRRREEEACANEASPLCLGPPHAPCLRD